MRQLTRATVIAASTVCVAGMWSGNVAAAPVAADSHRLSTEILPGVQYTSDTRDQSVVIETGMATLITRGGEFQVMDATGNAVAGVPDFSVEPKAVETVEAPDEIRASVRAATPDMGLDDIDLDPQTERFDAAMQAAVNEFTLATGVGTMVGGAIGAAVGCGVGAVGGGIFGAPILDAGGLTVIAGCLAGAGVLGGLGSIAAAAIVGVPVGIASAVKFQNTMNQPV